MLRSIAFAGLVLLSLSGCVQTFDATTLGVPATMAAPAGQSVTGPRFKVRAHTVHGILGLVTISQANMARALSAQLVGGKEVANVKVKTKSRWTDLLVSVLTVGLIIPRTVEYEGIILGQ